MVAPLSLPTPPMPNQPEQSRQRILAEIAAIPRGQVRSYGEVAARAGLPGRARLVARVLSELPAGHPLPWYRVLRAGAVIAFTPGSADFLRQRAHLLAEGCSVNASGRVQAAATSTPPETLDAALWADFFATPPRE